MEHVQEFIKKLCESDELKDYNRIRIYLDEDYNSAEHFTALGSCYFIKKTVEQLRMWNFLTHEWEEVIGKSIHTGNIETVPTKEKSKFPQHFFPEVNLPSPTTTTIPNIKENSNSTFFSFSVNGHVKDFFVHVGQSMIQFWI